MLHFAVFVKLMHRCKMSPLLSAMCFKIRSSDEKKPWIACPAVINICLGPFDSVNSCVTCSIVPLICRDFSCEADSCDNLFLISTRIFAVKKSSKDRSYSP